MDKDFESKLWAAADALRGNISSENYMHIILGILFLKYMSDKYDDAVQEIKKTSSPDQWELLTNDTDFLIEYGVSFVVPEKASWSYVEKHATQATIGEVLDEAFILIEERNNELIGLFDKNYNREELDQGRLGQVISIFSNIPIKDDKDIFGRIYEFFLGKFFLKQGQKGGEFYTPKSIVDLLCRIVNPEVGTSKKIYDPTAGTGGMLVQARRVIEERGGDPDNLVAYGQELMNKTWKLSKVNLLLHGFDVSNIKLGSRSADTLKEDLHQNEKFDYIMANPPFNIKVWGHGELENDERWKWGIPPKGNANYAFLSHMISKLNTNGRGATVLANGSLSGSGKDEVEIRKNLIKDNKIKAIISLPDKLFYTTGIPVCIWVFGNDSKSENVLMIEAKDLEGNMLSKKNRELTESDILKIVKVFEKHDNGENVEELGFAKTVTPGDIEENDWSFVPGRYVGILKEEVDVEATKADIKELGSQLNELFNEFNELVPKVKESIKKITEE